MKWEKKVNKAHQMVNHLCFFRNSLPWNILVLVFLLLLLLLVPLIGLMGFFGLGFFFSVFFITSTTLVLSTLLFFTLFSKPINPVLVQKIQNISKDKDVLILENESKEDISSSSSSSSSPTTNTQPNSPDDSLSESEFLDDHQSSTTEDSEVLDDHHQWPYRNDVNIDKQQRSPAAVFSDDGSISDEESLIEISLPSGHYVDHRHQNHEEVDDDQDLHHNNKDLLQPVLFNPHQKKINNIMAKDLFPDSCNIFKQRSLMELLAEINNEMNEEENLIEIDISVGSIKCSRFEIQA